LNGADFRAVLASRTIAQANTTASVRDAETPTTRSECVGVRFTSQNEKGQRPLSLPPFSNRYKKDDHHQAGQL
jgi:hypothetical protein